MANSDYSAILRLIGEDRTAAAFNSATERMRRFNREANQMGGAATGGVDRLGGRVSAVGGTVKALAGSLVGLGAVRYLAGTYTEFASLEERITRVGNIVNAKPAELAKLEPQLRAVANQLGLPFEQVMAGMEEMAAIGGRSLTEMQALLPQIAGVARAADATVAETMTASNSLLENFKIQPDELKDAFGKMLGTANETKLSMADVIQSLPQLSAIAAGLGYTGAEGLTEVLGMLGAVRENTTTSMEATNALRDLMNKALGDTTVNAFKEHGIEIRDELLKVKEEGGSMIEHLVGRTKELIAEGVPIQDLFKDKEVLTAITALTGRWEEVGADIVSIGKKTGEDVDKALASVINNEQSGLNRLYNKINEVSDAFGGMFKQAGMPGWIDLMADQLEKTRRDIEKISAAIRSFQDWKNGPSSGGLSPTERDERNAVGPDRGPLPALMAPPTEIPLQEREEMERERRERASRERRPQGRSPWGHYGHLKEQYGWTPPPADPTAPVAPVETEAEARRKARERFMHPGQQHSEVMREGVELASMGREERALWERVIRSQQKTGDTRQHAARIMQASLGGSGDGRIYGGAGDPGWTGGGSGYGGGGGGSEGGYAGDGSSGGGSGGGGSSGGGAGAGGGGGRDDSALVTRARRNTGAGGARAASGDPGYTGVSPTGGGDVSGIEGAGGPLGSLIARGEGGYGSYNRGIAGDAGGRKIDFSKMTVGEVMAAQARPRGSSNRLFAVGKYQIIPQTMRGAVETMGIDPNTPFTPELQERIYRDYLVDEKRPAVRSYITGGGASQHAAAQGMANEFASVADPDTGRSVYGGVGGNRASTSAGKVKAALEAEREQYKRNVAAGMSPDEAWLALSGKSQGGGSISAESQTASIEADRARGAANPESESRRVESSGLTGAEREIDRLRAKASKPIEMQVNAAGGTRRGFRRASARREFTREVREARNNGHADPGAG